VHFLALVVHVLAAALWVGGTVALVFAGVPAIRLLDARERGPLLRTLGRRWRPIGYGSLLALGLTGLVLADEHFALDWDVLSETTFGRLLAVKSVLVVTLVASAIMHDYVLGPRLQGEIREGRPPDTRPRLVAVGWFSFALTIAIPVLGVWMTTEAHP
jgi:putative copper export protein